MKRLMKVLPICAAALLFSAAAPGIAAADHGRAGGYANGQPHVAKQHRSSKHYGHRGDGRPRHARRHGYGHGHAYGHRHGYGHRRHHRHARRHHGYHRPYYVYAPYFGYRGYRH